MLYIFGGLPGSGKSTLSLALARRIQAVYLRMDTIEQAMVNFGLVVDGPAGYNVAYELARDNLRLGLSVVADSVNPLTITREAWRAIAQSSSALFVEIEVICSDVDEHRRRVDGRASEIAGLELPRWQAVVEREYHAWETNPLVLDTANQTPDQSIAALFDALDQRGIR